MKLYSARANDPRVRELYDLVKPHLEATFGREVAEPSLHAGIIFARFPSASAKAKAEAVNREGSAGPRQS